MLVVAALSALIAGCASGDSSTAAPETTETATLIDARPRARPPLGRAPTNCAGTKPPRERVADGLAPLVGAAPAWAGFYARFDETRATLRIPRDAPVRRRGWRIKVLWVIKGDQTAPVTISGRGERGGRLWFDFGRGTPQTKLVLDPAAPGHPVAAGAPLEYPSYLYVPRADCYTLVATSSEGAWRFTIGIGR